MPACLLMLGAASFAAAFAANKPAATLLKGDAAAGREKADTERCLECHGAAGPGQGFSNGSDGKFAKLGGQYPDYIVKQVLDFRTGRRRHEFMKMMADSVSDADLADIAAYFAEAPTMPAMSAMSAAAPDAIAQRLYKDGDPARQVAACAGCHGPLGRGNAGVGPVIGGQGRRYLSQQLRDWRDGSRNNSAGGVMNQLAKPLSDDEIEALAQYVSGM